MNAASGRYSRQMLFTPIGERGQTLIGEARVAVVGLGALGTVLASHMARAGAGYVRIIDRDFVEPGNLQRQMLFDEDDARSMTPKAVAAARRLREANSSITIEEHIADLNATNAESLLTGVDLILDGTDNFAVRYLINDTAVKHGIPWIYGGAVGSRGITMTIIPGATPCIRCLFPQAPSPGTAETCDTVGVISPIVHIVASYQATEALKWLVGDKAHLHRQCIQWDLWSNEYSAVDVSAARRADCPACGLKRFDYLQFDTDDETFESMCGRSSVQVHPANARPLILDEWEKRLSTIGKVERNAYLLRFHLDESIKLVLFSDGRVIVQGTSDPVHAKSIFSRYIGM